MKITVSFQNLEHTPALDERIHEKTQKLEKYLNEGKGHIKWNCFVKDNLHYAEIDCVGAKFSFHATAKSDSLYKTIDMAVDKIEKQLQKRNKKVKNRIHRNKGERPVILDVEAAWTDYDEEYYKDVV